MAAAPFDLIEEAKRLVRFNTVTWGSNADCAVHAAALMRKLGMQVLRNPLPEPHWLQVVGVLWNSG